MAAAAFKLGKDLLASTKEMHDKVWDLRAELDVFASALETEVEEHRATFDARSETWQQGERGEATSEWLDRLEEIFSAVSEAVATLEDIESQLQDMPETPEY